MALVELLMPKMGESIIEATVLSWLKKEGDTIEQDESILEVATDKVDTEVPSTHGGILKEILAKDGEVIEVGKAIAIIATDDEVEKTTNTPAAEPVIEEIPLTSGNGQPQANGTLKANNQTFSERFYSPLVKNIAHKEGIALTELETVPGSGKEGRVTKKDILNYVETRKEAIPKITQVETVAGTELVTTKTETNVNVSVSAEDEIIEMDRMRKVIAERMVDSKRTSPHVTSFVEADVTNVVFWRNRNKQAFKKQEGGKLNLHTYFC